MWTLKVQCWKMLLIFLALWPQIVFAFLFSMFFNEYCSVESQDNVPAFSKTTSQLPTQCKLKKGMGKNTKWKNKKFSSAVCVSLLENAIRNFCCCHKNLKFFKVRHKKFQILWSTPRGCIATQTWFYEVVRQAKLRQYKQSSWRLVEKKANVEQKNANELCWQHRVYRYRTEHFFLASYLKKNVQETFCKT